MSGVTRRQFLGTTAGAAVIGASGLRRASGQPPAAAGVTVLSPRGRAPLSFVIDDSTCLVNLGRFATPQFAEAFPDRAEYQKPWQRWPAEIPDAFVRSFGEWCAEHGVRGKYSVVPNPACVGWLDRTLPGWSAKALADSLALVRELMLPNWDVHPEMLTHTRVIDLNTGRPKPLKSSSDLENWYPGPGATVSTDELAAYLAAALRVLKNCGLPCTGVTTPGGFGNGVEEQLAVAVRQAVGDVFGASEGDEPGGIVRHFFKYVRLGDDPVAAEIRDVQGLETPRPECVVTVPAATGDWFGGWTGDDPLRDNLYCNADATAGRMVELIERGDPAVMLCHWPGLYNHGAETGFAAFRRIVTALHERFGDRTVWMKLSEIARHAAAKQFTAIAREGGAPTGNLLLDAPFACPDFTLQIKTPAGGLPPRVERVGDGAKEVRTFKRAANVAALAADSWTQTPDGTIVCFNLPAGRSVVRFRP